MRIYQLNTTFLTNQSLSKQSKQDQTSPQQPQLAVTPFIITANRYKFKNNNAFPKQPTISVKTRIIVYAQVRDPLQKQIPIP